MRLLIIDNAAIIEKNGRLLTGQHNGHFIRELQSLGHDISWFQNVQSNVKSLSCFDLNKEGVRCCLPPKVRNKLLNYILAYISSVSAIIKNDFCYIYFPSSFKFCGLVCRILGKKYGLYVRGMNDLNGFWSKQIIRYADIVLTVADRFTDKIKLINARGIVQTIRPMLELSVNDIDRSPKELFSGRTVRLLFLGRIDPAKGVRELLEAVRLLNAKYGPDRFFLKIVGNGHFYDDARTLAIDLPNVAFEGPVFDIDRKKSYFREADLYVLPTYHEGFPRTLYESMAYGTPALTTMVGGIPGLMTDGNNCIAIKDHSAEDIVDKIEFAMENVALCKQIIDNGFKTIEKVFDSRRPSHAQQLSDLL